ncbi:MAG TPA: methyltransferase domain-containing protein [Gemmatimonadaceae bacterium]
MTGFGGDEAPALLAGFDVVTSHVDINGEQFAIVHPRDAESLIDEAAFNRDERLPYWADLWPSAVALARAVRAMAGEGRTLLELGCGVGLVAAAALKAGFDVTASDYYDEALAFARLNGKGNAQREPKTMILDWRHLPTAIPAFDFVVGADVLYERTYGPVVARAIATTLAERGRALIADPGRVGSPAFFDSLHDVGLRHIGATVVTVPLNNRDHAITVHEIGH